MNKTNESCIRPLIYADIDLNLIDGSAVWVTSIVETLSQDAAVQPTLLLKRPIMRDVLTKALQQKANVTVINPWPKQFHSLNLELTDESWVTTKSLSIKQAVEIVEQLDETFHYDMFLVRGYALSKEIAERTIANRTWFYITDFPQSYKQLTHTHLEDLTAVYTNGSKLVCQTPMLIQYFKDLLHATDDDKFIHLPPMIPNYSHSEESFQNKHNRLVYAGKFTPLWNVPDMFQAFNRIEDVSLQFFVAGEKFHNYPYRENYDSDVKKILKTSPRIVWKKGLSRSEVQQLIIDCDVGVSWRHQDMNTSKELSTKVLEYGLYGKPVIMNRNGLHEAVFGVDYPLFANSEDEFIEKVQLAFTDPAVYEKAAQRVYEVSGQYTFAKVYEHLKPSLQKMKHDHGETDNALAVQLERPINLLFAGHDLKFARLLIDYFKANRHFRVKEDVWRGHNSHDEQKSYQLLQWADVIVAEWGLGNAVWYSRHKKKRQKLLIRMHRQEMDTEYPHNINWDKVDQLILISPWLIESFSNYFQLPYEKTSVFFNVIDQQQLDREKLQGSGYNLGVVGIVPRMKRLDLALDIFESLWREDPRYTLFVKGKLPNEYTWLWNRKDEKDYYYRVFSRINKSPWRHAVVFDGWGSDMPEWFRKIGFVLSLSDFESFHMAVAEGMASGAVPIIRDWDGAVDLYPRQFIFHTVTEAVEKIQSVNRSQNLLVMREKMKKHVVQFDKKTVGRQWADMILALHLGQAVQANVSQFQ